MEAQWIADRALLRSLAREHPTWTHRDLAEAVGRCVSWVKKWLRRFEAAPPDDREVLFSRSRPPRRTLAPVEPLEEIQLDFKDVSSVPADPFGKKQHVVEILNFVDAGTSLWLGAEAHADFHAQTALEAVVAFLRTYGRPQRMTFDRDPRWVGSQSGRDFPSALRRFLLCLGIEPNVCPPQRPDKNAFVERLHRTLSQECLQIHLPTTLSQTREVLSPFREHYNGERPHQGRACRNKPPRTAFPTLPTLPAVPEQVDPDAWLSQVDGCAYARKVGSDGCVNVDTDPYYVKQALAGQEVILFVKASERAFEVWHKGIFLKMIPVKRLLGKPMPFDAYVELMKEQARSEERQAREKQRRLRQPSLWA